MLSIKGQKLTIYVFVIISNLLLLFFIIFNFYTLNTFNQYKKKLNGYTSNISRTNIAAFAMKNSTTIDTDNLKVSLTKAIASLSTQLNSIDDLKLDDRYKADFDNLKLGLSNNIIMYKQLLAIFNNLNSTDISNSIKNVMNYEHLCNHYYSNIKSKNTNFSLPKQCSTNLSTASKYVVTLVRINKDNTIANTQKLEFENNINNILEKFNSIKVNLNYYAENARKKITTYDSALAKINQQKSDFNDILMLISEINVPEDNLEIYSSLKSVLSAYNSYLNSFSYALNEEKSAAANSNRNTDYSNLYMDANKKFEAMNKALETLKTQQNTTNNNQAN